MYFINYFYKIKLTNNSLDNFKNKAKVRGISYKILIFLFGLTLFGLVLYLISEKTTASGADHLVINEIYPSPNSSCTTGDNCEKEWIELFNPTDTAIDLGSYSIEDKTTKKSLSGLGTLNPNGYIVIFNPPSLNNDGDSITLSDAFQVIDTVEYGNFTSHKTKSYFRYPNGIDIDDEADFRIGNPTRGLENTLPVYTNSVIINETVPEPADGSSNEFVELYNTGEDLVDLSGWQLDDIDGGSSPYSIPSGTLLGPKEYLTFYNSVTKLSLNDSGDSVRLIDPNGDLKNTITYDKAIRGQSYSKFDSGFLWTLSLTPNTTNIYAVENITPDIDPIIPEVDIKTARTYPDDTTVKVIGIVSVLPGTLSSQYFYIEDDVSGIQIYCYSKNFPLLSLGDQIKVTGELTSYSNERRLKITDPSDIVILTNHSPPVTDQLHVDDLGEAYEGRYIQVTGTVTKTSGSTFFIHGSGEIKVIIRSSTGIKKPRMSVGDRVTIAGILSQYQSEYRILPTAQSDVKIIGQSDQLPDSGSGLLLPLIIALFLTAFIKIISVSQVKFRRSQALFWQSQKKVPRNLAGASQH